MVRFEHATTRLLGFSRDMQALPGRALIPLPHPHILSMTQWQKTFMREPLKTKAELREMLAEAVRNTAARAVEPDAS